ncbi:MAG: hypothetical protein H7296_15850 [Bacteroidia bacterium]|nr:hypothetical protein [Bacteroidia bacterium]
MKLAVIKDLVENKTLPELIEAETQLLNGNSIKFDVPGEDEGEQLTHILAAIEILKQVENDNIDLRTAIKDFFKRVRNSIS